MKKLFLMLFILSGLALLAAGCGGGQQADMAAEESPSDEMTAEANAAEGMMESEEPDETGEMEESAETEDADSMEMEDAENAEAGEESEGEMMAESEAYNGSDMKEFSSIEELLGMYDWQDFGEGIKYIDVREGSGDVVQPGDMITAYYTLWLPSGEMLQSNVGSDPFSSGVGVGRLIQGWDKAVPGMKVGGVRQLIIPGNLAYGANPRPGSGIPPNATLVFELMIVDTNR